MGAQHVTRLQVPWGMLGLVVLQQLGGPPRLPTPAVKDNGTRNMRHVLCSDYHAICNQNRKCEWRLTYKRYWKVRFNPSPPAPASLSECLGGGKDQWSYCDCQSQWSHDRGGGPSRYWWFNGASMWGVDVEAHPFATAAAHLRMRVRSNRLTETVIFKTEA